MEASLVRSGVWRRTLLRTASLQRPRAGRWGAWGPRWGGTGWGAGRFPLLPPMWPSSNSGECGQAMPPEPPSMSSSPPWPLSSLQGLLLERGHSLRGSHSPSVCAIRASAPSVSVTALPSGLGGQQAECSGLGSKVRCVLPRLPVHMARPPAPPTPRCPASTTGPQCLGVSGSDLQHRQPRSAPSLGTARPA